MASIGQLKLPDNNNYNLSVPFVIGTGSTAGTWLGTLTGLTAYYDGLLILYKPSVDGASTTTLNLNSLGAKTCFINNGTKLTTHFPVNQPILLAYSASQNRGCWMCIDNYWTNSIPSATCGTASPTAAKVASCDFYKANANSYVQIVMRNSNTSETALTLDINSKGAKPIYINGTASSASNYTLPAGSYIIFYDGTNYYFRTDGKLTANITGDAGTVNGHTVAKDVPSSAVFTDTRVKQTLKNTEGYAYPILFSKINANDSSDYAPDEVYRNNSFRIMTEADHSIATVSLHNKDNTRTIALQGSNGNIECTTINSHLIPKITFANESFNFTSSTTLTYIGKSITCATGHRMLVRLYFRYVNSGPIETAASKNSTTVGGYYSECLGYGINGACGCLTFMLVGGETVYLFAKYASAAANRVDIATIDYVND